MQLDSETFGLGADLFEIGFLETFIGVEIGNQDGIQLERRCVIQQRICLPTHRSDGKIIETETDSGPGGGGSSGLIRGERARVETKTNSSRGGGYTFEETSAVGVAAVLVDYCGSHN